jgi:hypothetical protein
LIFHKREPAFVVAIDTCAADPGYPVQYYNGACESCPTGVQIFTPEQDGSGNYVIAQNTITCDGVVVTHAAISVGTLPDLVAALNTHVSTLGLWISDGSNVLLTETTCDNVIIPWVT